MVLGLIGLGDMGFSLAQELIRNKITVVAYDHLPTHRRKAADNGIVTTSSVQAVLLHLPKKRIVFCVLESVTEAQQIYLQIQPLLEHADILVNIGFKSANNQLFKTSHVLDISIEDKTIECTGSELAYHICKPIFETIANGKTINHHYR
jgi:6-phosphogluconate dehydrogenase (decarboxylating)